jgi:hypothetical protein
MHSTPKHIFDSPYHKPEPTKCPAPATLASAQMQGGQQLLHTIGCPCMVIEMRTSRALSCYGMLMGRSRKCRASPPLPDDKDPQLRPLALDKRLHSKCTQRVSPATKRGNDNRLHAVKRCVLMRSLHTATLTKCRALPVWASVQLTGGQQLLRPSRSICIGLHVLVSKNATLWCTAERRAGKPVQPT